MNQKSVSSVIKLLAFLPLLLLAGGAWYYLGGGRGSGLPRSDSPAASLGVEPAPAARSVPPGPQPPPMSLDIRGPADFKAQVTAALKLIWSEDRATFLYIRDSLSAVRNENRTGFYMDGDRPVAAISRAHAFRSVSWCAGILAHQAWHARYFAYSRKKSRPSPPLPGETQNRKYDMNPVMIDYKGLGDILEMENRAAQYQLQVLRKVKAPRSETEPLLRRAPRDFTLSHDGNYSLRP